MIFKLFFTLFLVTNSFCMNPKEESFELFNNLPEDLKHEVFKQKLISMIKKLMSSDCEQDYIKDFFNDLNNYALVNKEFNKFVNYHIPRSSEDSILFIDEFPLYIIAIENGLIRLFNLILDEIGLDQREKDISLQLFAIDRDKLMIKKLINKGADPKSAEIELDRSGAKINPLNILDKKKDLKNYAQDFFIAAIRGEFHIIKLFLQNGFNVDCRDKGKTALILAYNGSTNTVKLLLKYGANVNLKDECGRTALYRAVKAFHFIGDKRIIKLLLKYKADKTIPNNRGKIPYEVAISKPRHRFDLSNEVIELLKPDSKN